MLKPTLAKLVDRKDLSREEIALAFEEILEGKATPAQIGAFLVALRMKGETPEEIAGAAEVMRRKATVIRTPPGRPVLDTCGTGGDGSHSFNLSTAVALVAAAAGATVAKHGNRSVSSKCGSADVLAACGVAIDAPVRVVERCIAEAGIGFLFAPALHGVMRHVLGPRRELGMRSIFNLLGPLSNPAGATHQLLGVYDAALVPIVAKTLARLGIERALVVHGEGGLDELSPWGTTRAAFVENGQVRELSLMPEDAEAGRASPDDIRGGEPSENASRLKEVLGGGGGKLLEAVVLNAAAALWVSGLARNLPEGGSLARSVLASGLPLKKLSELARLSQGSA